MSDGLKTALIVGGAAVAGYLIWKNSQATVANLTTTGTSTSATAPGALGSPAPTSVVGAVTVGSSTSTASKPSGPSVTGALKTVGLVAAAPVIIPTVLTVKAGEAIGSGVVSAGKAVGSAASSVGHAIASIF